MSVPSIRIEPLSGLSSPISVLRKTDLPVPEGPSMTETSPAGMSSVTSPQISCLPNDLVRPSTLISTPMCAETPLPRLERRRPTLLRARAAPTSIRLAASTGGADAVTRDDVPRRRRHTSRTLAWRRVTRWLGRAPAPDLRVDRRHDLVQVADHGVRRLGDHRCVGVGVDRQDRLRAAAAGPVLDRAADAAGDVEVGRDPAPGLADLLVVRPPAERGDDPRDARGTRRAGRRARAGRRSRPRCRRRGRRRPRRGPT